MSTEELIRGFFAFLISSILAYCLFVQYERESSRDSGENPAGSYTSFINPLLLPLLFVIFFVSLCIYSKDNPSDIMHSLFSLFFGIFLEIGLYYAFLVLALPLLRHFFHARTCAILWIIPNYLYITIHSWMKLPAPSHVLWLKGNWFSAASAVWGIGFLSVMVWKSVGHLVFRRRLLRQARPVTDAAVLELWQQEQLAVGIKKANYRLVISPDADSPLSIGLCRQTMRVVLPDQSYTPEELSFIFRHELIHIRRQDSQNKFFLTFCTAMCWFYPLMWIAMHRSAEDLELSCDEMVLLEANEAQRRTYAELILHSAADGRGYTTCLSARASSLRYRLKHIVAPRKRLTGCVLLGLILFLLLTGSGRVAAAYGGGSGLELIFSGDTGSVRFSSCTLYTGADSSMYTQVEEEALTAYLSSLSLYQLTGTYSFSDSDTDITIIYHHGDSILGVVLSDHAVKVVPFDEDSVSYYYLKEQTDWDYIRTLLLPPAS